ncbi:energy-coupling factor transporter transmembrane component T family protein [Ethanoligenens harbinense]|uniref:Cobalt transport protein n=1 Tax=Ethanoligenens harbinense (strain DSM 18485 / JCM 12961 / CGMCC 1.5033 / YUAN-3) TaxID=663278 RepID=E6U474_ETHHY|nr:energy-coupling factor transporter transmembrane protein EcfT [Ethanoligenens harbinense]ADU26574.1 cobalt transport protein [Ethanoligenens harbinense YUAN-3]AVQ95700.1 energy-coupling factor transporter transmembrane protein EcfT [Ethanoligenens harbinense YUAN-3]AYF38363.1 energy-coupling factor transporter transmembrane protein EcfT [Ethanoligenens harbinense]AYF41108.1 energy-coupling factor transporter transmembrane protein EcfT [Ethanoligenens harbinense]QCN91939.1 energy-coupling fa
MIRDITIGQFFPGESVVHRMDPRMKTLLALLYMAALFTAATPAGLAVAAAFILLVAVLAHIPMRMLLSGIRPLLFVILLAGVVNIFYVPGHALAHVWIFTITREGIATAVFMSVRVIFLIIGASMLTYTTSPIMLTDGLDVLLSPLAKLKLPVHELSMMMTIALRFIPTLTEETDKIMQAQKARGADFESGNLLRRVKALLPILIPLFVSAFRRADELALAMDCRCYQGGQGRTRLHVLRFAPRDYLAAASVVLLFAFVLALNFVLPHVI